MKILFVYNTERQPALDTHAQSPNQKHTSTMWRIAKQLTHGTRFISLIPSAQRYTFQLLTLCEHIIIPTLKPPKCTSNKTTPYYHPRHRSFRKVDVRKCTGREKNTNKRQTNSRLDKLACKNRWPSTHPCLAVTTTAFSPPDNILALLDRSIQIQLNNLDTAVTATSVSVFQQTQSDTSCVIRTAGTTRDSTGTRVILKLFI
jgi:hypothetical protein